MNTYHLRIAGVGGQGTVRLAKTLAASAAASGVGVTMAERPRSAMRLGPITCDLCFNEPAFAPFIAPGDADAVLGMEPLDGILNAAYYLKKTGTVVLQSRQTPTVDEFVLMRRDPRRDEGKQVLIDRGARVVVVTPEGGDMLGKNYYMLGAYMQVCPELPVSPQAVEGQLAGQAVNLEMFRRGLRAAL